MKTNKLVCVVEGKGDVEALPSLCARIRDLLSAWRWVVDPEPIRCDRSRLVDERVPSPLRPARRDWLERTVRLAVARPAAAVLVTCDSDDDCPAAWARSADRVITKIAPGRAVMIEREYETWLLHSIPRASRQRAALGRPELTRDAKRLMRMFVAGYKPAVHQLAETRKLNLQTVWAASDSFDKLVRTLGELFEVPVPPRPSS